MSAIASPETFPSALTSVERQELSDLEDRIERGLKSYYEAGLALRRVRDGRLYRATHRTFEDYCEERWGFGRSRANQYVRAAQVLDNLELVEPAGTNVTIPEAHARVLAPLSKERQREVYETSVKTAPGGKVTAMHIRTTLLSHNHEREERGEKREDWGRGKSGVEELADKLHGFDKERKLLFLLLCAERIGHTERWEVAGEAESVVDVEGQIGRLRHRLALN